jgi:hypothetical protein
MIKELELRPLWKHNVAESAKWKHKASESTARPQRELDEEGHSVLWPESHLNRQEALRHAHYTRLPDNEPVSSARNERGRGLRHDLACAKRRWVSVAMKLISISKPSAASAAASTDWGHQG